MLLQLWQLAFRNEYEGDAEGPTLKHRKVRRAEIDHCTKIHSAVLVARLSRLHFPVPCG